MCRICTQRHGRNAHRRRLFLTSIIRYWFGRHTEARPASCCTANSCCSSRGHCGSHTESHGRLIGDWVSSACTTVSTWYTTRPSRQSLGNTRSLFVPYLCHTEIYSDCCAIYRFSTEPDRADHPAVPPRMSMMSASIDWWLDLNTSLLLDVLLNDTGLLGNNESASSADVWDDILVSPSYWCLLLLVFPTCTVFGNILVCLSVYQEKALHTVTNYFISSLAVADIMVAILVMPLAVYVEVRISCARSCCAVSQCCLLYSSARHYL